MFQWATGKIGQVNSAHTIFGSNGEDADAAHRYGPPAAYPPQSTGWDDGAYKYPPRKAPGYGGGYPPQPQPTEWDDDGAYAPQRPPGYGGHPPSRAVDGDGGAQEKPPAEQEPPNAKKEPENLPSLPKASPTKHEGNKPPAADPPQKQPYGCAGYPPQHGEAGYYGGGSGYPPAQRRGYPPSRPSLPPPYQAYPPQSTGWDDGAYKYTPRKPTAHHGHAGSDDGAYDEYPPQHGEAGYYGGGGGYPPPQRRGYPPSRPSLPPPYQGGGQWDGYAGASISYMQWPKPAPPAGAYATYGAYHKHHGGYGGGGYGGGGYGYGNGKYTMGHRGKFKHYAHHQGKY